MSRYSTPLPERVARLEDLAVDLWWAWNAEARNVFQNIDTVIKDAGGRGLRDVVDVQVYLVDIERDFRNFNAVWKEFMVFEDGWKPARTTVQVPALPLKEIFVELKCIAMITRTQ